LFSVQLAVLVSRPNLERNLWGCLVTSEV